MSINAIEFDVTASVGTRYFFVGILGWCLRYRAVCSCASVFWVCLKRGLVSACRICERHVLGVFLPLRKILGILY